MLKDKQSLGDFIRNTRKNMGITLRVLEERSGISYSQLSKIERNESIPIKPNLEKLADAINVNKNRLFILAGYLPDDGYVRESDEWTQLQIPELSNEYAYNKLEKYLLENDEPIPTHAWFEDGGLFVSDFNQIGDMIHEKIERYRINDIINDKFNKQMMSLSHTPKKSYMIKLFGTWLEENIGEMLINEQETITDELKDFVLFKKFQLELNKKY